MAGSFRIRFLGISGSRKTFIFFPSPLWGSNLNMISLLFIQEA